MNVSNAPTIGEMIRFSWAKSREILFPFNFRRWLKVLIIVWLAGAGIQGFGANFKTPVKPAKPTFAFPKIPPPKPLPPVIPPQIIAKMSQVPSVRTPSLPSSGIPAPSVEQVQMPPKEIAPAAHESAERILNLREKMERPKRKTSPALFALLVAGMAALGTGSVALIVFFLWLSCRFNFVLLDTIISGKPAIKEPFKKYKEAGNSYFAWTLAFLGISLLVLSTAGLAGAGLWVIAKGNAGLSVVSWIFAGFPAFIMILAIIVVGATMHDFVLPIMYREKIPAMRALDKFLKAGAFRFGKVLQYLFVVFGLWIFATILQGLVGILAAIGGLIAGGIVAIPGFILFKALPFLKLPLIVLGGLLAIAFILAVVVVIGIVMLPVAIFFRVLALAYLTRLYPECDLSGFNAGR